MGTLRDVLIGTGGSLLAAALLYVAPKVAASESNYVVVAAEKEVYGSMVIDRLYVRNYSNWGVKRLRFEGSGTGKLLAAGVYGAADGIPLTGRLPVWEGQLRRNEEVRIALVWDGGGVQGHAEQQFTGEFFAIAEDGIPSDIAIQVRTDAEHQIERVRFLARMIAIGVGVVIIATLVVVIVRRRSKKSKNKPILPGASA